MPKIIVIATTPSLEKKAHAMAQQLGLSYQEQPTTDADFALGLTEQGLQLQPLASDAPGAIIVDFIHGALAHRRRFGGGKGQLIAKAIGLSRISQPTVLDVTAGLGRDAFVLACLGCNVTMLERSPILAALIEDGLTRAREHPWFRALPLRFIHTDAVTVLQANPPQPDVIYIDPMYPETKKTAQVKKEMQILQTLLGKDDNGDTLLYLAKKVALQRVVVKRPKTAPFLADSPPNQQYIGKSTRFDVYYCHQNQIKQERNT